MNSTTMTKEQEKQQSPPQRARENFEKHDEKNEHPKPLKRDEYVTEWAQ